ncbi:MAG: NAD(P)H-hydrate epimerase [Candidatus Gorgyraea atricola]|nr:NAD(P)H-hydrate epimerase [Candidatus Gorgyraea atricola]
MRRVSVKEMQEMDRKTIEEIGIASIVLMENAGRKVAEEVSAKRVAIFCGTGNNGGDGLVAARHLANKGAEVQVYIIGKISSIKNDPKINLDKLMKIGVAVEEIVPRSDLEHQVFEVRPQLLIDAIFGIGLKGEVREPARSIIADLNKRNIPILSIDVPSGLNADTGEVLGEAIRATKTVTMQFPKKGFYINKGPEHTGEVIVVDIGIPEDICAG